MKKRKTGIELLTDRGVKTAHEGTHSDGKGLMLLVERSDSGALLRRWIFRYYSPTHRRVAADGTVQKQRRYAGMGTPDDISLKAVRDLARQYREQVKLGKDPLDLKHEAEAEKRAKALAEREAAKAARRRERHTLRRVVRDYHQRVIEPHRTGKHSSQWCNSIEQHVPKKLLERPIEDIQAKEILDVLLSLRSTIRETGRRVGQRLGLVFADARLRDLISNNPMADIKPALRETRRERDKARTNFAALPYAEVPAFVKKLRDWTGTAARALEFAILCAARTGEVIGCKWSEVDLNAKTWTIPPERMKAHEQHVVQLSDRAVEILEGQQGEDETFVFPSPREANKPMSNMALLMTLRRMGVDDRATVHGFRSSFSTWAYEIAQRAKPDLVRQDVIEACLAHAESDRVKRAYSRAKFDDDRRELLGMWSTFLTKPTIRKKTRS